MTCSDDPADSSEQAAPAGKGRLDRIMPWVFGNLLVVALLARDLLVVDPGMVWGRDFLNVWTSGKLLLAGRLDILYDVDAYHAFATTLFGPVGPHNYSYPPLVLPLMVPFALLPYGVALAAWLAGTGWLFARAARPWWNEATGLPSWLVLLTPAALINIWAGHYGFLIGALLLFGWRHLEQRRLELAGICFGLMAIKPHLAILVPLVLLMRGEWKAIASAALTVALLVVSSALVFGIELWRDYLTTTSQLQVSLIDAGQAFFRFMSTSFLTALLQLGVPRDAAMLAQGALAVCAMAMVADAARKGALRDVALLAATATFLVLPYAFNYDLTVSAMGAAMLLASPRLSMFERRVALAGFMAAQIGMLLSAIPVPGMTLLLFGLAALQYCVAVRGYRARPACASVEMNA